MGAGTGVACVMTSDGGRSARGDTVPCGDEALLGEGEAATMERAVEVAEGKDEEGGTEGN